MALIDQPLAMNRAARSSSKLGVSRLPPHHPEVIGGRHDPLAEVVLPDPVDHHPGQQRIPGINHPLRKFEPAAPRSRDGLLPACDRFKKPTGNHIPRASWCPLGYEPDRPRRSLR